MLKIILFKLKYNISDELIWAKKLAMCPSIAMIPLAAVGSQSEIRPAAWPCGGNLVQKFNRSTIAQPCTSA